MASSSASSSSRSWNNDVFLSFRGEDTRKNFVDHLYAALKQRLIRTYKDDETLPRGDSLGPSLLNAIQESRIAVIIFSKNYANSSWCLDELVYIMKCRDDLRQTVIPIFYDVVPSEVRKQEGEFGKAFAKLQVKNITKTESWRNALADASDIVGWEPKNIANGHESKIIKEIVDSIFGRLFPLDSDFDEDLVGIKARLEDLKSRLEIGSGGVHMIGIWGVGGGGKTTLASAIYREISSQFEGHCIVDNIREESIKHGLKALQEKLLSTVLKTQPGVQSVEEGRHMIKSRLCHSNVLVLLDDVDDHGQLEALAGSHKWFGSGSRIIITTRDEHLLRKHKADHVYPVSLLSKDEAIKLFKRHAYNEKEPVKNYENFSLRVISYAAGLPLALKVLGSFLYDKNEEEWTSTLVRLKDIPEMGIMEKLKISYDGLKPLEKELFLHIACFFRGGFKDDVMEIFEACGFHPVIGIKVLTEKSLITLSYGKRFDMHDLVQEMGHHIVRGEHPNNPEKHSILWKYEEIEDMCFRGETTDNNSTEAVQCSEYLHNLSFCKIVSNMKKLRFLSVTLDNCENSKGPTFLSNELRYINLGYYPESTFPHSFHPTKLVLLDLKWSMQKELWKGYKHLPQLKVLKLYHLKNLLSTPDFNGLPSLKKLELYRCKELEEIHPSLGNHRSLEYVSVSRCRKLRKFPTIVQMEKLETLKIKSCSKSFEFQKIQTNMESLVNLSLERMGIDALLSSIEERCTNLTSLCLLDCYISTSIEVNSTLLVQLKECKLRIFKRTDVSSLIGKLVCGRSRYRRQLYMSLFPQLKCTLRELNLSRCRLKDGEIPSNICELSNLLELDLCYNDFTRLDFSLWQLTRLKHLKLSGCKRLVVLPELPSSMAILIADSCKSLTAVGDFHTKCKWLCEVSLLNGGIITDGDRLLQSMLLGNSIENRSIVLRLQGHEIPKGFIPPILYGDRCTLLLQENWCNEFSGFLMCAALLKDEETYGNLWITMKHAKGGSMDIDSPQDMVWEESVSDDIFSWVGYVSFDSLRHTAWLDETCSAISFSVSGNSCSGFGVRLVPRKRGSGQIETSTVSLDYSDNYTHKFKILRDPTNSLTIRSRTITFVPMV